MEPAAAPRLPDPGREDRAPPAAPCRSPKPARTEAPGDAAAVPGRPGSAGRRRRRGGAPQPAAGGAAPGPGANSLLLRRGRLKRNVSAAAASSTSSSSSSLSTSAAAAALPPGLAASAASAALCTRSLDRKTLLLRHRPPLPLPPSERDWVRQQLRRGCVHVFDRHLAASYLRPVLCTLDTTAAEVAARLLQAGPKGVGGGALRVLGRDPAAGPRPRPADLPLPAWPPRASAAPSDCSPAEALDGAADPAADADSFSPSPGGESGSERLDPYGGGGGGGGGGSGSSSEEQEAEPVPAPTGTPQHEAPRDADADAEGPGGAPRDRPREEPAAAAAPAEPPGRPQPPVEGSGAPPPPSLYVQLHGETTRRLEADEKPLQIQNDYLFQLGFGELWRVQEEGMDSEVGCLIRFYAGKPHSTNSSERIQLSGMYNVRKGKMQLPVNRWTRRQVILCGTCLIVSSVKDSLTGKMHVLPLIGGKVEEVKKHQHCLAFSSSGPQSQTYYICFDTFTEYLRWLRQVSKVASQRISSVDLSCCSLEHLPANLFYSQDLTHLNLKQNFLRQNPSLPTARGLSELQRFTKLKSLNLSNNHLGEFPLAVCNIPTLTELNVSCNALQDIPAAVGVMHNLQTFLLDGNFLQALPAELENMHQLSYLGLSFNEFTDIPEVLEKLTAVDKLCMSGNCMETLRLQALRKMPNIKHVDLR
ncbi:PH domain leucine-rich repeat-containing protein phosphatase 1 isoform X2 [Erinaceus europaeus]|nr:PH domain leucine-rich repeat-containing protein phosphatase 1 isoform X2 [Erinaceus europaeus]